jgi:hypothetical protein
MQTIPLEPLLPTKKSATMALDAQQRSSIYRKLVPVLGDADANTLMSQFPSLEADELVTKQFLRAEISGVRGEMHTEFADVRGVISDLRGEMHTAFADVRGEISDLRGEMHTEFADVRGEMRLEIERVNTNLERKINHQTIWLGSLFVTALGVLRLLG